ncbi:MAG TPA: HAMP domain-containing sensor histidine kinase [Kofleriaceae bacterium]|nr:HAMP domain-containing sensor histidine kinase [Kofleriaceae bacterium]
MIRSHDAREVSVPEDRAPAFEPRSEGLSNDELEHRVRTLEALVRAREAERDELAVALREAQDGQRDAIAALRAGEEILAVVAHDLRNPLGTIVMGAATLVQGGAPPDPQRIATIAERIQRQSDRMAQQITNLGDFAAIQAGRLALVRSPQRAHAIVNQTSEQVGPLARERNVAFEVRAAADLPPISCDPDRVVQALANLVGNALKVTPRGGAIEVGARGELAQVVFFVRDTGPGLAPEELATMFGPRWQSRHSCYRGTGLGFAIARGIIDAHGGRIWADSAPGCGTTVYFSLASVAG